MSLPEPVWRSPEELVELGFRRARLVMMNEAHNGLKRSIRTRLVGRSVLPAAHAEGARFLAMEALCPPFTQACNGARTPPEAGGGYLSQPEMRALIQAALDLGWTLLDYEADSDKWLQARPTLDEAGKRAELASMAFTNWREEEQARNIAAALDALPAEAKLLVWCGNGHHAKAPVQDWVPMGWQFVRHTGLEPFVIDQTPTVRFGPDDSGFGAELAAQHADGLRQRGGTAGFLKDEGPSSLRGLSDDAFILSTENGLE